MTIPAVFSSRPTYRLLLAGCAALTLLACEGERVSVGEVPCAGDARADCDAPPRELIDPLVIQFGPDSERPAAIVWEHTLPSCWAIPCDDRANDYLVHEDGEVTLAVVSDEGGAVSLRVAWLDQAGAPLFESEVTGSGAWLQHHFVSALALRRDAQGQTLLLVGRARSSPRERDTLRAYALARSGEITLAFEVESETIIHQLALLDADVAMARADGPNIELGRYPRQGAARWRQKGIASIPTPNEVGFSIDGDTRTKLTGLAVDRRGRIWGSLFEGLVGLVQLDPDGFVAWHALVRDGSLDLDPAAPRIAIDSRDRPIVGFAQTVLRFEPDGTDQARRTAQGSSGLQEQFYPQTVQGLAVDRADRIYVATQDGSRSHHRLLIERISEDLRLRERFVLPLTSEQTVDHDLNALQLSASGDAYVRIVGALSTSSEGTPDAPAQSVRIARVHLGE